MSRKSLESRKLIASELQARLNNIEMMTSKDDIIRQLNTNIVFRQEEVLRDLWKFIQSDDDITYILQESLTDKITSDENITYHELIQLAKTTMTSIIIGREDIQDYFNQLGYYLIQQYKKKLFRMQSLLENFERGSLCNLDILQDYDENKFLYDDQYTTQEKVIFDLISPLWVPSRFSTNLIQSIEEIDDDEVNEIIANYCQHFDSEKLIKEKLIVWFKAKVISIMEDSFQRSKVIEAMTMMMKPVIDSFDNYFSILPTLFQFYRNLLQHILSDDNHTENVPNGNDSSNQLLTINQHLSRLVMLFNVRYVRQAEFNPNQLVGYDENYSFDHNSTAAYSTCQLRNKDVQFLPITLKIFNRKVSSRNIIKLLSEEEALRKLNHKNILTFYGLVSLEDRVNNFTMACEICHCSLKKFFDFQNDCIPADFPFRYNKQQCAYRKIKIFALQIAAGLCYIHNACYVHPDLYLDNILLSIDNTIKLCDPSVVFQSASIDSIKNSQLPIYPAPEYLAGNVYNHKCDMYHYGLILHEMWYNKPLIDLSNSASLSKDTVDKLLQGVNPDFSIYPPPPDLWQYIITKCLQFDPNERLSSSECYKALQYRSDYEDPEETTSPIIC
ncbi:uncharacterized protein TRIADDRAFT_55132 [Trichoplax adhaerens]|uniref:Protein kinase domain-containing protein n=1 Tax=Trichoplax adhaerens TaxID=10228 RepID=B3RU25_TRIAD|nr:hypothetical protein TRIADDRAFT_55132 [Trichoplax adhaerens]EDV25728.1 hypothetical protein TRIADDRAFT_55132 [Trichoplax adhaerens]|eukprot:XP_002111761.1 hypothetical protein TRIADDRAFT_55132 [Trichoplax adhaerens]